MNEIPQDIRIEKLEAALARVSAERDDYAATIRVGLERIKALEAELKIQDDANDILTARVAALEAQLAEDEEEHRALQDAHHVNCQRIVDADERVAALEAALTKITQISDTIARNIARAALSGGKEG